MLPYQEDLLNFQVGRKFTEAISLPISEIICRGFQCLSSGPIQYGGRLV